MKALGWFVLGLIFCLATLNLLGVTTGPGQMLETIVLNIWALLAMLLVTIWYALVFILGSFVFLALIVIALLTGA